jgi:hypothetical protein
MKRETYAYWAQNVFHICVQSLFGTFGIVPQIGQDHFFIHIFKFTNHSIIRPYIVRADSADKKMINK